MWLRGRPVPGKAEADSGPTAGTGRKASARTAGERALPTLRCRLRLREGGQAGGEGAPGL